MNQLRKVHLFLVCLILLISCGGNQDLTETPSNPVSETNEVQEELIPLLPSSTPEPYQRVLAGTPFPVLETVISPENVNSIVELARWGDGIMQQLIVSPDGKFAVIASSIGFYIFSLESLEVINFVELNSDIGGLAINPNGDLLVVSTRENVLIFEFTSLHVLHTIERSATNLIFSPDGKMLAMRIGDWNSCSKNDFIELWNVNTWSLLQTMDEGVECIGDLIFSPSSKYLALSSYEVLVWEINESESKLQFRSWGCDIFEESLTFTKDEKTLIIGTMADSGRNKICLIRVNDGETLGVLENESELNYSCAPHIIMSPDGNFMAASLDGKISIWQVDELKRIYTLGSENKCFYSGGWLPDNKTLLTLSTDKQLQIWNVFDEKLIYSEFLLGESDIINVIAWSPDGKTIATGNLRGIASLWEVSSGEEYIELENKENITSLAFSPDSMMLAVGLDTDQVNIWNLFNKKISQTLGRGIGYRLTSVTFSADGELFVSDLAYQNVRPNTDELQIWQTDNWKPLFTLTAVGERAVIFTAISISNDKKTLSVTAFDHVIRVWNINTKEIVYEFEFPNPDSILVSVIYSPDNRFLAVSRRDGNVGVWSLDTGEMQYLYENPNSDKRRGTFFLYSDNLAWSPDGQIIAISMPDGTLHLIKAGDGTLLKKLSGHTLWATGVTFSPDGKMLASSSFDGTVRLWGIPTP